MRSRSSVLFAALLACALPVGAQEEPPPAPEKDPASAAAQELVERYVELIKQKKTAEGLEKLWSFPRLCEGIFKGDWKKQSAGDQAECAKALHQLLLPTLTDPRVADAMAGATYEGFTAKKGSGGQVEVRFTVTLPLEGAEPTAQFVWVEKVGDELKIVDMANGSADGRLTRSVGAQWAQTKKQTKGITPLEYVRLMAQGR